MTTTTAARFRAHGTSLAEIQAGLRAQAEAFFGTLQGVEFPQKLDVYSDAASEHRYAYATVTFESRDDDPPRYRCPHCANALVLEADRATHEEYHRATWNLSTILAADHRKLSEVRAAVDDAMREAGYYGKHDRLRDAVVGKLAVRGLVRDLP